MAMRGRRKMRHLECGIGKPQPTMRYERHYRILRYSKVLGVAVHGCIAIILHLRDVVIGDG